MRPGLIGGANWDGGAFDVETGVLCVKTSTFRTSRGSHGRTAPRRTRARQKWTPTM